MQGENIFQLPRGETLFFTLLFEKSKKNSIKLGSFQLSYEPLKSEEEWGQNAGKITVDMKVESKFKTINSHTTGYEIIGTDFMNTLKADYMIEDMKRTVHQSLVFDGERSRISIDETLKMHKEKNERPMTNIGLTGPPQIYNHTALLYKLRALDLRQSEIVSLAVLYQRRLYPVLVEYQFNASRSFSGEEIPCRVYGLRSNRGKVPPLRRQFELNTASAWISDDSRRFPLRFELNTQEGNLAADLNKVSTG
ncbi:MAG: DUF3108 domain-containing protein [Candidatus Aminicenantes bacterium]|nr:DUF3108 domain-containing protein [Candidatus Aminicenantes bacterium]